MIFRQIVNNTKIMIEDYQQINILLTLSFFSGFFALAIFKLLPFVLLLLFTYALPYILSKLNIFSITAYDLRELLKIRFTMFVFGVIDFYSLKHLNLFSIYLIILSIYHTGEFQLINVYHHKTLSWSSFLIYHSREYSIANAVCLLEHSITKHIFNFSYKNTNLIAPLGFVLMIGGLFMRLLSFYTAKSNFTHLIQYKKRETHELVTHGIYKYVRHPGYLGFFLFSIGSMIFIGNWFCFFAYFAVLSKFFKERIQHQEETLVYFFDEYESYRKKTPTYLPFVK